MPAKKGAQGKQQDPEPQEPEQEKAPLSRYQKRKAGEAKAPKPNETSD